MCHTAAQILGAKMICLSLIFTPFPIASDQAMEVFRKYFAYDDFEEMPLHGTFPVDGDSLVRWQDISYEPFTDVEFVLAESQRLLKLPAKPAFLPSTPKLSSPE